MTTPDIRFHTWEQLDLFGDEVFELTLRVGVVPAVEHVQLQFEVTELHSDRLLTMVSRPHVDGRGFAHALDELVRELRNEVERRLNPFGAR